MEKNRATQTSVGTKQSLKVTKAMLAIVVWTEKGIAVNRVDDIVLLERNRILVM